MWTLDTINIGWVMQINTGWVMQVQFIFVLMEYKKLVNKVTWNIFFNYENEN